MEWIGSPGATLAWRAASALMLAWAALFFGRTLLPGRMPLIERIARVSDPDMTPAMCRYTRRLTLVWCVYFILAAMLVAVTGGSAVRAGVLVWAGTALLFVGEHRLRPHLFRGRAFPGLMQQLRDTVSIWRPHKVQR